MHTLDKMEPPREPRCTPEEAMLRLTLAKVCLVFNSFSLAVGNRSLQISKWASTSYMEPRDPEERVAKPEEEPGAGPFGPLKVQLHDDFIVKALCGQDEADAAAYARELLKDKVEDLGAQAWAAIHQDEVVLQDRADTTD